MNTFLFCAFLLILAGGVLPLLHGTGTRDLNQMGGLLRRMPHTGRLQIYIFYVFCSMVLLLGWMELN